MNEVNLLKKFRRYPFLLVIIVATFLSSETFAQVKLPAIFSDGMVLQSGKPVKIWGTASAGEPVTVSFGKQKKQTKIILVCNNFFWIIFLVLVLPSFKII